MEKDSLDRTPVALNTIKCFGLLYMVASYGYHVFPFQLHCPKWNVFILYNGCKDCINTYRICSIRRVEKWNLIHRSLVESPYKTLF